MPANWPLTALEPAASIERMAPANEKPQAPWAGRGEEGGRIGAIRTSMTAAMWTEGRGMAVAEFLDLLQAVIDRYRAAAG
jgi:hypothetical protein